MAQPSVGVVVVGYRSQENIAACLRSILAGPVSVCVVVNNSRDEVTRRLVERLSLHVDGRLKYLEPPINLGYGRACNRGIASMERVDYVAVVNPDVELTVSLPSEIERANQELAEWTIIAGRLGEGDRVNARELATLKGELLKAVWGARAYRRHPLDSGRSWQRVEQLDGALLVLRTEDWRRLGGFDPAFELYYEDVDLCARANELRGCWLQADGWGRHVGGVSFGRSGGRAFVALRVSRLRYLRKNFGAIGAAAGCLYSILELFSRGLGRCPEGWRVRSDAVRLTMHEYLRPGSVVSLEAGG